MWGTSRMSFGPPRPLDVQPSDRLAADRAGMVPLPPVGPAVGLLLSTRLPRDYYVRLAGNDYPVHPEAVGRLVDAVADHGQVVVTCSGRAARAGKRMPGIDEVFRGPVSTDSGTDVLEDTAVRMAQHSAVTIGSWCAGSHQLSPGRRGQRNRRGHSGDDPHRLLGPAEQQERPDTRQLHPGVGKPGRGSAGQLLIEGHGYPQILNPLPYHRGSDCHNSSIPAPACLRPGDAWGDLVGTNRSPPTPWSRDSLVQHHPDQQRQRVLGQQLVGLVDLAQVQSHHITVSGSGSPILLPVRRCRGIRLDVRTRAWSK